MKNYRNSPFTLFFYYALYFVKSAENQSFEPQEAKFIEVYINANTEMCPQKQ